MATTKGEFIKANTGLAQDLQDELKQIIKDVDLIDTGLLYDTVTAVVKEDQILLYTQDYLKYNDEKYGVTDKLIKSKAFKNAEARYEQVIRKRLKQIIK